MSASPMNQPARRRRRVRPATDDASGAGPSVEPGDVADQLVASTAPIADEAPPWVAESAPAEQDFLPAERGLRGLVGGGSSQITPAAAMRARDAARPRPEDLARAESDLTIVRRHWSPRD
jgi:hypothetical protein